MFFFVNLCSAQGQVLENIHEVSSRLMTWSYHIIAAITEVFLMCWSFDSKYPRYAERRQRRWGGYEDVLKVFEETRGTIKIERPGVSRLKWDQKSVQKYAKMFDILMFNWEIKAIYDN